jgi:hypothetical protein
MVVLLWARLFFLTALVVIVGVYVWTAYRTSGASTLKRGQIAERGARLARREERAYWARESDEQRRQPGCPAREAAPLQRGLATIEGQER